jgi:hypothetical protein
LECVLSGHRGERNVESHPRVERDCAPEGFLCAVQVTLSAPSHDADVHPGFAEDARAALVFARRDDADEERLGLVELCREIR